MAGSEGGAREEEAVKAPAEPSSRQNVQVCCRIRPLVPSERRQNARSCVQWTPRDVRLGDRAWPFDMVFPGSSQQEEIFQTCVQPLVHACFEGYNATVLAYGQTGSGKTFTMGAMQAAGLEADRGIIPRALSLMLHKISAEAPAASVRLRVGYLEIYNEEVRDLLHPEIPSKNIAVREARQGRILVQGAREEPVETLEDVIRLFALGNVNRTTGSTLMNDQSSRSHAIFTVFIANPGRRLHSKFHLVDLAGSERAKRTGAEGLRLKESVRINQGLLALGKVISALSEDKAHRGGGAHLHVPYRESKLTRLLQDSLGGNSSTVMLACVSPADNNLQETVNTLKYASRARKIQNTPVVNEVEDEVDGDRAHPAVRESDPAGQAQADLIANLQAEIAVLNSRLGDPAKPAGDQRAFDSASKLILDARGKVLRIRDFLHQLSSDTTLGRKTRQDLQQFAGQIAVAVDLLTSAPEDIEGKRTVPEGWSLLHAAGRFQGELHDVKEELKRVETKLRDCMDDLSRDEEIFADKLREIKELQAARDAAMDANKGLEEQLAAAQSATDPAPVTRRDAPQNAEKLEEIGRLESELATLQEQEGAVSSLVAGLGQGNEALVSHHRRQEELSIQRQKKMSLLSTLEASRAEAESLLHQYASRIRTLEDQARAMRVHLQRQEADAAPSEEIKMTEQQLHTCMIELRTLKQQNSEQQHIQELQLRTQQRIVRIREDIRDLASREKEESVMLHQLKAELSDRRDQLEAEQSSITSRKREVESELRRLRHDSENEWGEWVKIRMEAGLSAVKRRQQILKDRRRREEVHSQRRELMERQRETRLSLNRSQRVNSSLLRVSQTIRQLDEELQASTPKGRSATLHIRELEQQRAAALEEKQRLEEEAQAGPSREEIQDKLRDLDDTLEALDTEIEYSNHLLEQGAAASAKHEEIGAGPLRWGLALPEVVQQVAASWTRSLEQEARSSIEQILSTVVSECLLAQHALESERLRTEEAEQARTGALRELAQGREALQRMREESTRLQEVAQQAEARVRYLHTFLTKTQVETPPSGVRKVRVSSKALREIHISPPPAPTRVELNYSARLPSGVEDAVLEWRGGMGR